MKKFIILLLIVISSTLNSSTKVNRVNVYKGQQYGDFIEDYIIIKSGLNNYNTFERFIPGAQFSILGKWEIIGDTLFLLPEYDYTFYYTPNKQISPVEIEEDNPLTIYKTHKYLIKGDSLIDMDKNIKYNKITE